MVVRFSSAAIPENDQKFGFLEVKMEKRQDTQGGYEKPFI